MKTMYVELADQDLATVNGGFLPLAVPIFLGAYAIGRNIKKDWG